MANQPSVNGPGAVSEPTLQPSRGRLEAPVRPGQRILTIDILRGFAILGILLVNMALFNRSVLNMAMRLTPPATPLDQVADWLIKFFAEGKFYSIFSFLFGLGMAIQFARAEEHNARFGPFWIRRMLVLLLFGLIHAFLIWPGDILSLYKNAGKLMEVSDLNPWMLARILERGGWPPSLEKKVKEFATVEKNRTITLSKLKERD